MKGGHALSIDYSKPKPCADFDRVKWDICLVGKRREQVYWECETSCIADEIIRSLRKRWSIIRTTSSVCVHFYNVPFSLMMWLKCVLISHSQKSKKRPRYDTYLLMKIEGHIGKVMISLNFSSWMGHCRNWCHAFGGINRQLPWKMVSTFYMIWGFLCYPS